MKLNPFSKKSSAYYGKVKAEYYTLNHELAGLKKQLESAKAAADREKSIYEKLSEETYNTTENKSRQHRIWSEACNCVSHIEDEISQINSRISPLRNVVDAPDQYITAKKTLEDLFARQMSLNSDREKTDERLAEVGKHIDDFETRIAAETTVAAQSLLSKESEFVVPELLTKLYMELRLRKALQVELQTKSEALVVELRELLNAINEGQRLYMFWRMFITEIELNEQLMPIMDLFARTLVARYQYYKAGDDRKYEIEISHELIESAEAALTAEIPTA
jgi:chromosome segregation ATPase